MAFTVRYEPTRNGVRTDRYVQGWSDPGQDRKPAPNIARILSQNYEVIKRDCLARNALWEDPEFPATHYSAKPSSRDDGSIEWLRPKDICKPMNSQMSVDGFSRFDVKQGYLGNCWFLAATASLCCTRDKSLLQQVVPPENRFDKDYAGVFHFRIWHYGKWLDVVIDDQLPTSDGKLIYASSATKNEFWPALLEKAYAKVNGSYEVLEKGSSAAAMQDFTGGVTETFTSEEGFPKDLLTIMKKAFERDSLMGCSIKAKNRYGGSENKLRNGLVAGHSYSITSIKQITVRGRNVDLIRLRNPWADDKEWNGAWSDQSPELTVLSDADKKSLGLVVEEDGEFWMSYDDLVSNFTKVEMCMTVQTFGTVKMSVGEKKQWEMKSHGGSWTRFVNAGGHKERYNRFWSNPQYRVQVVTPDDDQDDNKGTLIVALLQKEVRKQIAVYGGRRHAIGYYIYAIADDQVGPQNRDFFQNNQCVDSTNPYKDDREVVGRHRLSPGSYLIIPTTYEPDKEGDFLLRIFSEKPTTLAEVDENTRTVDKPDAQMALTQDDRDDERDLKELFRQTAGSDMVVDAYELRSILELKLKAEFNIEGVSLETARSMLAMMDIDHSGRLDYTEFEELWNNLRHWKKVFLEYDVSKTNSLSGHEMREALVSSGFIVSNHTLKCIVMRYSDPKGYVQFDDFLLCVTRLNTMFAIFQTATGQDTAACSLDQLIQTTMYA